jgi:peptidoglycan hydrolase-like protein with peptidoglycan-binding domain
MTKIGRGTLAGVLAAVLLASCTSSSSPHGTAAAAGTGTTSAASPSSSSSTASPSTTTSTTEAPTTTTSAKPAVPVPGAGTLGRGARGLAVLALEQRLEQLHYDAGAIDGTFDGNTTNAVIAFQKVNGLARTGRATKDVLDKLPMAGEPAALVAGGGATRVEVDLPRQVLFLYKGGGLFRILPISTGSGKRYCVDGQCATAVTPGGSFRVSRRISGWRTSRLGKLYNPLYFNGGIAIHGAPSVPASPASHGCVRIPMSAAAWFPQQVPNGTPVYVVGGRKAPVPFNEPAPSDASPDASTTTGPTTSTTVPTSAPPTTGAPTTTTTAPAFGTTTTVPAPTTTAPPTTTSTA